jgi:hypothetical protein
MPDLELWFALHLSDHDVDTLHRHAGPVFHRWLPEGLTDAIVVPHPEQDAIVRIWFERRGYVDERGYVVHDLNRHEVDPSVVPRQGVLDAGPLFGGIDLEHVPADELTAVRENAVGSSAYVALGTRIVKKLIDPTVQRLTRILRDLFGQYWIQVPTGFDSRECSLGHYCNLMNLKWKDGSIWKPFEPTERTAAPITLMIGGIPYRELLGEADWPRLASLLQERYNPSLAVTLTARAHRFLQQGNISQALIQAVTALEISIDSLLRSKLDGDTQLQNAIQTFWAEPLRAQLSLVTLLIVPSARPNLHAALACIDHRNKLVHDGIEPGAGVPQLIEHTLELARDLLGEPYIKYPPGNLGNELRLSPDHWNDS